ncbi:Dihydrolipoamide acetyltransferase [Minicystis rosea]|nr:Dihydrolipoamide acetyltransferase [Minicystis rosea]
MSLGFSTAARADQPAAAFEEGAELLAQARELWAEGTSAFNHGQLERARLLFLSAFRAQHHWQIAGSLGHVEMMLGRHRDAAEHLSMFLRESRDLPNADPRDRVMLTQELERARARIGVVNVSVDRAGAEVFVDGASVGKAPLADPVFVEPGKHLIEIKMDGYEPQLSAREMAPGATADLKLTLVPAAPAPVKTAAPPLAPIAAPPAAQPWQAPVVQKPNRAILYGGIAGSVVAASVGIGLAIGSGMAGAASHDCTQLRSCGDATTPAARHEEFDRLQDQKVNLGYGALGSFIGAGLIAAGTATYYAITSKKRPNAPQAGFVSQPGGGAATFSW